MNNFFFKFCGDCSAGRSGQKGSRDNKSIFQSPWSSHFDLYIVLMAGFEKCEYKEGNFHRHMSNKFVITFKVSPNCVFIVLFSFFTVIFPACQRLSYDWRPRRFVNMMTSYNRRKFYLINKHRIPNQVIPWTSHNRKYLPRVISAHVAFPLLSHNLCHLHCS